MQLVNRRSPFLRVARALVGILTIWSMGARAYEPMTTSRAECASDASMAGMDMGQMDMAPMHEGATVAQAPEHGPHHADCTSACCEAVSLTDAWTAAPDATPPAPAAYVAIAPSSVTRAPSPPPPERTA